MFKNSTFRVLFFVLIGCFEKPESKYGDEFFEQFCNKDPMLNKHQEDRDCDGFKTEDDCDDENPNSTNLENDWDCDGVIHNHDCDDSDPERWSVLDDADCDGVLTVDDCDDFDPSDIELSGDCDQDGVLVEDDCDDTNNTIYPSAFDAPFDGIDQDCDGVDATTCPQGQIFDCNGNCALDSWFGDGLCEYGLTIFQGSSISFACSTLNFDDGDCVLLDLDNDGFNLTVDCDDSDETIYPGAFDDPLDGIDQDCDGVDATTCPQGQIFDCNGNCALDSWLGDDFCDDGLTLFQGSSISLSCPIFDFDDGDCPPTDVDGDGYHYYIDCDDSDASINPRAFDIANDGIDQNCDGQDVETSCSNYLIGDCYGICINALWLGDGICDDGSRGFAGNSVDLNCASYNYDDGDCSSN